LLGNTPAFVKVLPGALRVRVSGKAAPGLKENAQEEALGSEKGIPVSLHRRE